MSKKSDIVIIGGGLIGLLTAVELSERGASVSIIEKDDVGFEQSARSVAAINLPGGPPNPDPSAAILRVSAEEWATFEQKWECPIDLNDEGWFIVVANEEDEAWLETERATWASTAGFTESQTLKRDEAVARFPQLSGPFLEVDARHGGHVDAIMVMKGLREAVTRRGIGLQCGTAATGFTTRDVKILAVETTAGSVPCIALHDTMDKTHLILSPRHTCLARFNSWTLRLFDPLTPPPAVTIPPSFAPQIDFREIVTKP